MTKFEGHLPQNGKEREREKERKKESKKASERASWMPNAVATAGNRAG